MRRQDDCYNQVGTFANRRLSEAAKRNGLSNDGELLALLAEHMGPKGAYNSALTSDFETTLKAHKEALAELTDTVGLASVELSLQVMTDAWAKLKSHADGAKA